MDAVAALEAGLPVLLPTDTVYGLVSLPGEAAARRLYGLKGRKAAQPTAILAATVDALLAAVPELPEEPLRTLLPGAYTLVLEVHEERAAGVARILADGGYAAVRVTPDLAGRERIVEGRWTP